MSKPVVEERFEYKGFPCVVLFMPMGFRNGYVGLPKSHKYYKKEYEEIPMSCHCGLTYGDTSLFGQEDEDTYWIGFDCGHCCDGFDLEKLYEYYGVTTENATMRRYHEMINKEHEFRTVEYVKNECMKIVDQLLDESEKQ